MSRLTFLPVIFVILGTLSAPPLTNGAALDNEIPAGDAPSGSVALEDVKTYIQPILYQKVLHRPNDSPVVDQAKILVSEYLADSLVESIQYTPQEPIRLPEFARQATNGTGISLPPQITALLPGTNSSRPSQQHVISQVDRIIQNVNEYNISGIVDQALLIRAPAPVRQLVNGILGVVLCNPFNRIWNRCYGGGSLLDGRRR